MNGLIEQVVKQVEPDGLTVLKIVLDLNKFNYQAGEYWFNGNKIEEIPLPQTSIKYQRIIYLTIDNKRIPCSLTSYYNETDSIFLNFLVV